MIMLINFVNLVYIVHYFLPKIFSSILKHLIDVNLTKSYKGKNESRVADKKGILNERCFIGYYPAFINQG